MITGLPALLIMLAIVLAIGGVGFVIGRLSARPKRERRD
jgi:preprotein translocase subunit Sss1